MGPASVILLEFNELCPSLMDRFIRAGRLPNFQRLRDESRVYVTEAGEEAPYLEPWIQWVTVHSGLSFREHQVFHLADGHALKTKCVWDLLSERGKRVWVCGSMNIRYDQPIDGMILPDPWAQEVVPSDPNLEPYVKFVHQNVLEYTNERIPLSVADHARFLYFMATHGLSAATVRAIASQLLAESRGRGRWKRAALLDKLQFDVFAHYYRKLKPTFATFFLNSTAHFQHLYWRNMEPESFEIKPTAEEQAEYSQAVLFGYQEMDRLLARFRFLADRNTTLIFCTALSQQACLKYEHSGGKLYYRPKDVERLLAFAGIHDYGEVIPVMSENFNIRFKSEHAAAAAKEQLAGLKVGTHVAFSVEQHGSSLYAGCPINKLLEQSAMLSAGDSETRVTAPFFEYFYRIDGMKSGMHHPAGMLWICRPDRMHHVYEKSIPLTSIAPMLLDMLSVPLPTHMRRGTEFEADALSHPAHAIP